MTVQLQLAYSSHLRIGNARGSHLEAVLLHQKFVNELFLLLHIPFQDVDPGLQLGVLFFEYIRCYLLPHYIVIQPLSFLLHNFGSESAHLQLHGAWILGRKSLACHALSVVSSPSSYRPRFGHSIRIKLLARVRVTSHVHLMRSNGIIRLELVAELFRGRHLLHPDRLGYRVLVNLLLKPQLLFIPSFCALRSNFPCPRSKLGHLLRV